MQNNRLRARSSYELWGNDNRGKVFVRDDKVIRQIKPEYIKEAKEIFGLYKKYKLVNLGIVPTQLDRSKASFTHPLYTISYPHEWTYSMFRDAMTFQLDLVMQLSKIGLTLKDFLPNNVVFNYSQPVFVDFLSMILIEKVSQETWLYERVADKRSDFYRLLVSKMFVPYMLIPLLLYAKHDYSGGRKLLEFKVCNLGNGRPTWKDLLTNQGFINYPTLKSIVQSIWLLSLSYSPYATTIAKFKSVVNSLNLSDPHSPYLNYYPAKGEDYSLQSQKSWKKKQKNVYRIIRQLKPKTTLDIGANTGWYSFLAEKLGSSVIATDVDEGTIDLLYQTVKRSGKNILPLLLPFDAFVNTPSHNVYIPPITRFSSDLVMCLALIHHLVLGQGLSVAIVIRTLAKLAHKAVILEYVDINDEKIQQNQSFFPMIKEKNSHTYNLPNILKISKQYFTKVEIIETNDKTRKLLFLQHE